MAAAAGAGQTAGAAAAAPAAAAHMPHMAHTMRERVKAHRLLKVCACDWFDGMLVRRIDLYISAPLP